MKKKIISLIAGVILFLVLVVTTVLIAADDECISTKESADSPSSTGAFSYPVDKNTPITSGFGMRWGEMHQGVDFGAPLGAPIYAFADGVVVAAQDTGVGGFGGWVVIDHTVDGKKISTVYGHEDPGGIDVKVGDTVTAGQKIAKVGNSGQSSGPHLHFEVWEGGRLSNGQAVDPEAEWLKKVNENPTPSPTTSDAPTSGSSQGESVEDFRAQQIVARGEERKERKEVIIAALAAAQVESGLKMLASEAVPESKQYPNDGVTPGDYDSVGLFQIRVSIHGPNHGGVKGLMDPVTQIDWFFDTAKSVDPSVTQPGLIAADVERPREDLRGKYSAVEAQATARFEKFTGKSAGTDAEVKAASCSTPTPDAPAGSSDLAEGILAAARSQFGLPYVWGGGDHHGPTGGGFDCSGLTMYAIFQASGGKIALEHHTDKQEAHPSMKTVSWEEKQPGDILFFAGSSTENPWEKYHHVSIYSGEKDGQAMQYEAQTFGVNSGEYPVRMGEPIVVKRVTLPTEDTPATTSAKEEK